MFNKPVINVGYNPRGIDKAVVDYARYYSFDHYRPLVESGAVRVAWSEDKMKSLLREALAFPDKDTSQRGTLIDRMFGKSLDGYVGERIAECLLELVRNRKEQRA